MPERAKPHDAILHEQLTFEALPENVIVVASDLINPHRLVVAAAKAAEKERTGLLRSLDRTKNPPKLKPGQQWVPDVLTFTGPRWSEYESRGCIMSITDSPLPLGVSIESIGRALRIWDALLKAFESRNLPVSPGCRVSNVTSEGDHIFVRLSEIVDLVKPKIDRNTFQPTVRRPTGRLRLVVAGASETRFDDTAQRTLEIRLNDIIACVRRKFALQPIRREQAAEKQSRAAAAAIIEAQQREEAAAAARLREEELRRQQADLAATAERERLLLVEATAWRDAGTIRAYAAQLRSAAATGDAMNAQALEEWLAWADTVADRLDPTGGRLRGGTL